MGRYRRSVRQPGVPGHRLMLAPSAEHTRRPENSAKHQVRAWAAGCGPQDTFLSPRPSRSPTSGSVRISFKIYEFHSQVSGEGGIGRHLQRTTLPWGPQVDSSVFGESRALRPYTNFRPPGRVAGAVIVLCSLWSVATSHAVQSCLSRFHLQPQPDNQQPRPSLASDRLTPFHVNQGAVATSMATPVCRRFT